MSVELTISGIACNLKCPYCYQNDMRAAHNVTSVWNWEAIQKALLYENQGFTVFGGEPLTAPIERLEQVFAFGLKHYGHNGIQTNGALITSEHLSLFETYRVHVGFSTDGPEELSDTRWAGTLEETRATSAATQANIEACLARKIPCSIIFTLWTGNCSDEGFFKLVCWLQDLDTLGMKSARIHTLEVDSPEAEKMSVPDDLLIKRLLALATWEKKFKNLKFDKFQEYVKLLRQDGHQGLTCVWNACDPLTTDAVHGVATDGTRSNCGRTNKDGIDWIKADSSGHERQLALYNTPQEYGGCKDCRFFLLCKGECPGTGIDKDWRNRTTHCNVIKGMFTHFESLLVDLGETPVSLNPKLREMETEAFNSSFRLSTHTDTPHVDTPHEDWHLDHTDNVIIVPVKS